MKNLLHSCRTHPTTLIAAALLVSAACAVEPPADPAQVFASAFDLATESATVVASTGTTADACLCFTCDDRVQLSRGDLFSPIDPQSAREFFAAAFPEDPVTTIDNNSLVCLGHGDPNAGEWLLFELGSGRYYYRMWSGS